MNKKTNKVFIFLILISLLAILPFFVLDTKNNPHVAHAENSESWKDWSSKEDTSTLKDYPRNIIPLQNTAGKMKINIHYQWIMIVDSRRL